MLLRYSFLLLTLWCMPTTAQQSGLTGTVADNDGRSIVDARVTLLNWTAGVEHPVHTNDIGVYNFPTMVPGEYELRCKSPGFKRFVQTSLVLEPGLTNRVNITLEAGADEPTNEYENSEWWVRHPSVIDKCMDNEKTLAIDYSIHPYYLRVDLNGDGETEYVLSVMRGPVWKHHGLMVCHEDGSKTIYRGIADRDVAAEDKNRIAKTRRIVKDAVLIEGQTSEAVLHTSIVRDGSKAVTDLLPYSVARCCSGQGRMGGQLIFTEDRGLREIPLGLTWYPISKSDVLDRTSDMPRGIGEIAGEGIVTAWESATSVGFMQNGQFRWLIYANADPD